MKLLTDYQNQMDEIEKFCLSDGQINSDFTVQQTGTHTGNKISNQKFTMTHLRASTSREEIDTYSKSQCGKGIQSTSRSGTYDKDLGELILKDSLSGHSRNYGPSMKHPRRVFGYDDRYGFTMYIDEKAQNPNLKSCQDKIWKELANTPKWGNLQNKYVYIEMKDISGQKQIKSENNTCYPDFNKTNSKAS
jgi:plasmid replication initiation protein